MKEAHIIKKILLITMIVTIFFVTIAIYNLGYTTFYKTDNSYLLGYTSYKVNNDTYKPEFNNNDVLILKTESNYAENTTVVINNKGTTEIATIDWNDINTYTVSDKLGNKHEVNSDSIIGRYIINLHWFSAIFKIITSPYMFIVLIILVGAYFFVSLNEKNSYN